LEEKEMLHLHDAVQVILVSSFTNSMISGQCTSVFVNSS
jgi:hypothetical protein